MAEAVELQPGDRLGGSVMLSPGQNRYWYAIEAEANRNYEVVVEAQMNPHVHPSLPMVALHRDPLDSGTAIGQRSYEIGISALVRMHFHRPVRERLFVECSVEATVPARPRAFFVSLRDLGPRAPDDAPDYLVDAPMIALPIDRIAGTIETPGDVDLHRLELQPGTRYLFAYRSKTMPGPDWRPADYLPPEVRVTVLHDPSDSLLVSRQVDLQTMNFNDDAPGADLQLLVGHGANHQCLLAFGESYSRYVGSYELVLLGTDLLPPAPAPGEPGSSCEHPIPLTLDRLSEPVTFSEPGRPLWFGADLAGQHAYSLPASVVFGPDCTTTTSEPSSWPFSDWSTTFIAPRDGRYTFAITSDGISRRSVYLAAHGPASDDWPNHTSAAPHVREPRIVGGQIDYSGDIDSFNAGLEPGTLYRARVTSSAPSIPITAAFDVPDRIHAITATCCIPEVVPPIDTALIYTSPQSEGVIPVRIGTDWPLIPANSPIAYAVYIEPLGDRSTGVADAAPCEAPRTCTIGEPSYHVVSLDQPTHIAFQATRGRLYRVSQPESTPINDGSWGYGAIIPPECGLPVKSLRFEWPSYIVQSEFVAAESGQYRVRIGNPGLQGSVALALLVEDLGAAHDDFPDMHDARAAPLTVGHEGIVGRVDFAGDDDVFRVDLLPETVYEFRLSVAVPDRPINAIISTADGALGYFQPFIEVGTAGVETGSVRFTTPRALGSSAFVWVWARRDPEQHPQTPIDYTIVINRPACTTDFNADGVVDADDLGDFLNAYFTVPPTPPADYNLDGAIDADDLGDFLNAFFTGC